MDMKSHEFFSSIAEAYKQFRPTYPSSLVAAILAEQTPSRDLFVDVACGSGQLTSLLAPAFKQSVGVDKGVGQIAQAKIGSLSVEFMEGDAHKLPLPSDAADLLTCAQALHWFLDDQTFSEFRRVLKTDGLLAVASYAFANPLDEHIKQAFNHFYFDRLGSHLPLGSPGCFWQCDRRVVDSGYAEVAWPENFGLVSRTQFPTQLTLTKAAYMSYVKTFSALENLKTADVDPVEELDAAIGNVESVELSVIFSLTLLRKRS